VNVVHHAFRHQRIWPHTGHRVWQISLASEVGNLYNMGNGILYFQQEVEQ
jgi:hypothetical protein